MAAAAFLSSLPGKLSTDELALLAVLVRVGTITNAFLPPSVTLQAWAEKRVPDHLIDTINASGIVYVPRRRNPKCKTRKALPESPPPSSTSGQQRQPPSSHEQQPRKRQQRSTITLESDTNKRFKNDFDMTDFLSTLPENELSPEEIALRAHLILHLERKRVKAQRLGKKKKHNTAVPLSDIQPFEAIRFPLASLRLPMEYLLDWISARIQKDIEISYDDQGAALLKVTKVARDFFAEENHTFAEHYFSSLPPEEFTTEEHTLRNTLFDYLKLWHKSSTVFPTLGIICQDPMIREIKNAAMPSRIPLRLWIEARLGQELELAAAPTGQIAVGFHGQLPKHALEAMQKFSKATSLKAEYWQ